MLDMKFEKPSVKTKSPDKTKRKIYVYLVLKFKSQRHSFAQGYQPYGAWKD